MNKKISETKILLFDIETSPNLAYVWGKYEQNALAFEQEWRILSFAYKWLGDKKVHSFALPDFKNYKRDRFDDSALMCELHKLMSEADVVVGHNCNAFDVKKSNARLIANGFAPPEPFKTVDTYTVAKRYFEFTSNSLNDLGVFLGVGKKIPTGGFSLWLDCLAGDKRAWKRMVDYNKQDVVLLEKVYLKLLPWMTNHPNRALIEGHEISCPNCGGEHLSRRGFGFNRTTKYQRWQCKDCGAWSSSRRSEKVSLHIK